MGVFLYTEFKTTSMLSIVLSPYRKDDSVVLTTRDLAYTIFNILRAISVN